MSYRTYRVTVHVSSWNGHVLLNKQKNKLFNASLIITIVDILKEGFLAEKSNHIKTFYAYQCKTGVKFELVQTSHDLIVQVHVQLKAETGLQQDQE